MLYPGVGSIFLGELGRTLAIMWPMATTLENKVGIKDVLKMLERLPAKKAKEFMKDAIWCTVEAFAFLYVTLPRQSGEQRAYSMTFD